MLEVDRRPDYLETPGVDATIHLGPFDVFLSTADGFAFGWQVWIGRFSFGWYVDTRSSR